MWNSAVSDTFEPIYLGRISLINSKADGLCSFEIFSDVDYKSDVANANEIRNWAAALIDSCSVNGEDVKSGTISKLGVLLLQFYPQCHYCAQRCIQACIKSTYIH